MRLPPIPKTLDFPTGTVSVSRCKGLMESERSAGKFNWCSRSIELDRNLGLHAAWLTLLHERVHVVLMDAGVEIHGRLEERVCDAIAADAIYQMLNR